MCTTYLQQAILATNEACAESGAPAAAQGFACRRLGEAAAMDQEASWQHWNKVAIEIPEKGFTVAGHLMCGLAVKSILSWRT